MARRSSGLRCLLVGLLVAGALPEAARAAPALYTGSVHIRMWQRAVPYGTGTAPPALANPPPGDAVSLQGTGPAAFGLTSAQLTLATSLIDLSPTPPSLDFRSTRFTGANDAGSFFAGGAPEATGFAPSSAIPASELGVSFSGPLNRFGGVMRLLGRFDWRGELASCTYCPYHTVIPLSPIGGPFAGTATATTYVGGSVGPPTFVTATVWGFPWDTGTVAGVADVPGTGSPTATTAMGTDLRTASGLGTLQLVTPFLVRVASRPPDCGGCVNRWYYAGVARAELHFVPEPAVNALLAAGLGILAVLDRRRSR